MTHSAYVWRVRFNRDGNKLVTASFDGTAQVWNGHTGAPLGEPMNHGEMVYDAVWSDDSSCILTYGRSDSALLWDVASSRRVGQSLTHSDRLVRAFFVTGRNVIATCSRDGTTRLWSMPVSTTASAPVVALEAAVITGLDLGPDNLLRLLDVPSWRSRRAALETHRDPSAH